MLEVRDQNIRKTELYKSLYPFGFFLHLFPSFPARMAVLLALLAMIVHLTASVKAGLLEEGAEMNIPSGAVNSGNLVLSLHLGDSLREAQTQWSFVWGRQ